MAETDAARALRYRNRALHIRITAQALAPELREAALKRAAEYDLLADDIECTILSLTKGERARSSFGHRSYLQQKPQPKIGVTSITTARVRLVRFLFRRP
jgi:hypothetical protein